MRVSVDTDDPGYTGGIHGLRVFLDGSEVTHILTADEEKRMILQLVLNDAGLVMRTPCGTDVLTQKRYGHVRIELPPEGSL